MPQAISNGLQGLTNGCPNGVVSGHSDTREKPHVDGFSTRAIHVGSDPDEATGAVIPALFLSTTYKQNGVGNHKVRIDHFRQILRWVTCGSAGLRIFPFWKSKP